MPETGSTPQAAVVEVALNLPLRSPLHLSASRTKDRPRPRSDKTETAPLLAALDGLKKETRLAIIEPLKDRERRVEISHNLARKRNEIPFGSKLGESVQRRAEHGGLSDGRQFAPSDG